jgi:hypothetical protein
MSILRDQAPATARLDAILVRPCAASSFYATERDAVVARLRSRYGAGFSAGDCARERAWSFVTISQRAIHAFAEWLRLQEAVCPSCVSKM